MDQKFLNIVDSPEDLKKLSVEELSIYAEELREFIVDSVSVTGGHLASSLGAIEIAVALHYALQTPKDKIIWDVGHQAYPHKIITGRRDSFSTLRQKDGISGFPKPSESPFDTFVAGHSSTSISSALGVAAARDLAGDEYKVVSVIGDGSLTAGLAFEGLNQAGHIKKDMIVLLNDNEMSISKNVGALSSFLSRKFTGRLAMRLKKEVETFLSSVPKIGEKLMSMARKAEDSLITLLTPGMLFEGLGFHYIGPIDGHDIKALVETLSTLDGLEGPILLHVLTKKGKGYAPAESDPSTFHGLGPFDKVTGAVAKSGKTSYTNVFSYALLDIAEKNKKVVAITAAMPGGTGLSKFEERFPDRFFDVGIAEQHAITFAAGLAKAGFMPVCAIYSTFLQRAYDEVVHDICIDKLPIVIAIDRAGIVGADGPTHHGIFDIAYLRHVPNMVVTAPKDDEELRNLLYSATKYGLPTSVRYPRGAASGDGLRGPFEKIPLGKAELLKKGADMTIIALGTMVGEALKAAMKLEGAGINAGVLNARFVKPMDEEAILAEAVRTGRILTIEEGSLQGGFGSAVLEVLESRGVHAVVKRLGIPDSFVEHGTQAELLAELGLDSDGIEKAAIELAGANEETHQIANR